MALPMKQVDYPGTAPPVSRDGQSALYSGRLQSFGGLDFNFMPKRTFDDTPDQRKERYESLWAEGDFHFWLAGYQDTLFDEEANTAAYNFW
jgi:hypothetical protein